jgi:cytochrome c
MEGALAFGAALLLVANMAELRDQAAEGRLLFNNACRTCHTLKAGDNRAGPHLAGVIGRAAGAVEGYAYSSAMKKAGFAWDEYTLNRFLKSPDAIVPGHEMKPFGGIVSEDVRQAIVQYLKARP